MLHTSSLWIRVFHIFIQCWSRVGEVRGGFWLRGAVAASGLALTGAMLFSPGAARAADKNQAPMGSVAQTEKAQAVAADALQALHRAEEWMLVSKHLPSLESGSGQALETAGDILRARRFPEEAIVYYIAAYRRGADQVPVLNKLGVTELTMRHPTEARTYFKLVVKRDKKNYDGWNNLGATEYVDGRYSASVSDYRKALKLNPGSAVFHSNLGTALIGQKDFSDARKEFAAALELDPDLWAHRSDSNGISAHVLSAEDRAQFCLAMARVFATKGKIEAMLHSLTMAADGGLNLIDAMAADPVLEKYRKDPQVLLLIENSKAIKRSPNANLAALEPLPAAKN
jgi:tetratricopeptide (TPR) repeat protein